ncbi:Hypothetical predicted protein [Octopus vulgaris]|uniref:Uncharacterized protein n=1 Tax=Octopus vulgaris TaxID=6645 RepID=A0AA36FA48_OCTVU|nr:Hypothetical predicted protein [Octopus vulgaris]
MGCGNRGIGCGDHFIGCSIDCGGSAVAVGGVGVAYGSSLSSSGVRGVAGGGVDVKVEIVVSALELVAECLVAQGVAFDVAGPSHSLSYLKYCKSVSFF